MRVGLIALLVMVAGQAVAQDAPPAVGRISYGDSLKPGAAICTGVLVAPDLVLTARHCVVGSQAHPATVHFSAGYAEGKSAALGRGAEVILSSEAVAPNRANDVALLRLQTPVGRQRVAPLSLGSADLAKWLPQFSLIAYRRDAPELAERQDNCALMADFPGILALNCPVVSGNSGAPLLAWNGTEWQVFAVMVAAYDFGQVHSLAATLPDDLLARIQVEALP
jgi:protease YdgD